jgi:pimeloyl-ACP methyl ester carboxylesterase
MAGMFPELVSRIILIDAVSYNTKPSFSTRLSLLPIIGPFIFKKLYNWDMYSSFIYKDVYVDTSVIDKEEMRENYRLFDNPSRRYFTYRLARAVTDSSQVEKMIPRVNAPALIIWGEKDRLTPPENAVRLSKDLRDSKLVIIPGAGHAAFDEKPGIAIDAIRDFLGNS